MPLSPWLEPLPDAAQQRATDRWAIDELGIPSATLMERAGTALARLVAERVPGGRITVLAGTGNNGGDGHVAARLLRDRGREVELVDVGGGEPGFGHRLTGSAAVVDALLGTGFSGAPREPVAAAIAAINAAGEAGATVIACDVPSGVDASTGEVAGVAVRADHTVTFHAAKPGLWIAPGKAHAGELTIVDIGIPPDGAPPEVGTGLLTAGVLDAVPRRGADSNKFTSGHVLIVAGSVRYTGAPALVALSASRAGAGYVTVSVPAAVVPVLQSKLLEPMVTDHSGASDLLATANALVVGPGLGKGADVEALVRWVCRESEGPLVLDADGLNALAGDLPFLAERTAATVLTPHAGELGRLLACDSRDVQAHRLKKAQEAAQLSHAVVVLKGDDTIVTDGARTAISPGGVPALATAGTGDVLSGVIGAYLGKGMEPFVAACAGVYAHLRAGALAAAEVGAEGVIASDVIERLPRVFGGMGGDGGGMLEEDGGLMALRAVAEVDLAAIERNVALLRSRIGAATLCAVVKADAYGHGAAPVARAALEAGASMLAVATAGEALALREAGLGDVRIMVLGAISQEEMPLALEARAELTAWTTAFIAGLGNHSARIHVKLDTGMGRLGTRSVETALQVAEVVDRVPWLELAGVTTHFATSDDDLDFARVQLSAFAPVVSALRRPGVTVHAANSGATLRLPASHFDMVRCGIALYGADPMNEDPLAHGLEPALTLCSYVAAIKRIEPGQSAGYGRRFIAREPTYLATVPIGYGDGVRRGLTNNADVLIRGRRYPLVGTVSMDNITVDVGRDPGLLVGDAVTLIGIDGEDRITAEEVARRIGTINYEVLCGISRRVPRRYVRDGDPA